MSMIRESIVVTVNARGEPHLAPLGLIAEGEGWILAPFHPSTTLDNLRQAPFAVANFTDDVSIFAGCLTGRRDWPPTPAARGAAPRPPRRPADARRTCRRATSGGDLIAPRTRRHRGART